MNTIATQLGTVSNVRVISNVYPIGKEHLRKRERVPNPERLDGMFDDKNFRLQVRGKKAIRKLASHVINLGNDEFQLRQRLIEHGRWQDERDHVRWVEDWQIELYLRAYGSGRCVDCPKGARPMGLGWGTLMRTIENRCKRKNCRCR